MQLVRCGFGLLALIGALSITSCTKEDVGPRGGCGHHTTTTTTTTGSDTTTTVTTDTTAVRAGG